MTGEQKTVRNRRQPIIRALTWIGQRAPFLISMWAALIFYSRFTSQEISWQLLAFSIRFDLLPQPDLAKYMSYLEQMDQGSVVIGLSAIWVAICAVKSARDKTDDSSHEKGKWLSIMNPYVALLFFLLCIFIRVYTVIINAEWLSNIYDNNQVFLAIRNGLLYGSGKSIGFASVPGDLDISILDKPWQAPAIGLVVGSAIRSIWVPALLIFSLKFRRIGANTNESGG